MFICHTFSETFAVGNCSVMIQHRDSKIFCLFIFLCAFASLLAALRPGTEDQKAWWGNSVRHQKKSIGDDIRMFETLPRY